MKLLTGNSNKTLSKKIAKILKSLQSFYLKSYCYFQLIISCDFFN